MNYISKTTLEKANEQAIYNLYLYLADKKTPEENETLVSIVTKLESAFNNNPNIWKEREKYRLEILKSAAENNPRLANSKISNLTQLKGGLTACVVTKPDGSVSVIFKGTGSGEWIDNGEGLSGIYEDNTYITYSKDSKSIYTHNVHKDYATDQQVEALNWFCSIAAKEGWTSDTPIIVSGHSKGGNKAQFITINSDLPDECYSFNGQGFSPEALNSFKKQYKEKYDERRMKIKSISSENDYVNVLGLPLVKENQIYLLKSQNGIHHMEALLDKAGKLRPQCEQGKVSKFVKGISDELMQMHPYLRQYATLGIMNIFQKYLGDQKALNGNSVSTEKTIAGIGIAMASFLHQLYRINI